MLQKFTKGLILTDCVGVVVCFNVAYSLRVQSLAPDFHISWTLAWITGLVVMTFYMMGLYDMSTRWGGLEAPALSLVGVSVVGGLVVSVLYFGGFRELSGLLGRSIIGGGLMLLGLWCAASRAVLLRWHRAHNAGMRWLALCEDEYLETFWNDFSKQSERGSLVCLTKKNRGEISPENPLHAPVVGTWEDIDQWIDQPWQGLIMALQSKTVPDSLIEKLMQARLRGLPVVDLTDFYERYWFMVPVFHLHDGWFATSHGFDLLHNPVGLQIKSVLDKVLALGLMLLTLPILAMVAMAIRLESRGPVIFRQERSGEGGRPFTIYKFRSMVDDAEKAGPQWATEGDPRVTRLGRFLRYSRLDELPQMFNVLKGEMSFIGPRPERPVFNTNLEKSIPYFQLRNLVKPGITGWAQVRYRYGASVEDARIKLGYDLYYIKNYSLLLDLRIILDTVRVVLLGRGR